MAMFFKVALKAAIYLGYFYKKIGAKNIQKSPKLVTLDANKNIPNRQTNQIYWKTFWWVSCRSK